MKRTGIIMAGGSGERFWPLSRRNRPKQLLKLTHPDQSMLHQAVARLEPLVHREDIYIATGEHLVDAICRSQPGVPDTNIVAEPCKRNTAGCLAYGAAHLLARYGGDGSEISVAVTTADHLIEDNAKFAATVEAALETAEKQDMLVTIGVTPTRPETGYGYIQRSATEAAWESSKGVCVYPVAAFHEKPNEERARAFKEDGKFFWNSGMFFWKLSTFLRELETARPDFAEAIHEMANALRKNDADAVRATFETLENVSIDYALMEKAHHVAVAEASFPWDDIGAWPALDRTYPHDTVGNVAVGAPVLQDCEDCIVYVDDSARHMAVGVVGVKDLVVVVSGDAVLVVPKDQAQHVKDVVAELKERGADQL